MELQIFYAFSGFFLGAVSMISFHHLIVLYEAPKALNWVKAVVNAGNLLRFVALFAQLMLPSMTFSQCFAIQYLINLGNVIFRISFAAFLLWELRNLCGDRQKDPACFLLFMLKFLCTVPFLARFPIEGGSNVCYTKESQILTYFGIVSDFIVIFYIVIQLVKILHEAHSHVLERPINLEDKNQRSLYLAVVYWNLLRLFVAIVVSLVAVFSQFNAEGLSIAMRTIMNIILSYVVTIDAEIVRESTKGTKNVA